MLTSLDENPTLSMARVSLVSPDTVSPHAIAPVNDIALAPGTVVVDCAAVRDADSTANATAIQPAHRNDAMVTATHPVRTWAS